MNDISIKQILTGTYPRNSRLAQWDRRILKGIMNVVLFLALAGTTVDVMDLEGSLHFNPISAIDATFQRSHWGRINMDTVVPGFREKLPPNVELWSPGVWAAIKVEHPDRTTKTLSRLSRVPSSVLLVAIIWMLRSIVVTTVGTNTSEGDPFIRPNVRRLYILALLLTASPVIDFVSQIAESELVSRSLPKDFAVSSVDFSSFVPSIGMGLLVLVLAEVFKIGVRLREDVEGLV